MEGKNVVIVGASSGLGLALAELFAKKGSSLFLLSRTIEEKTIPFKATKIKCDATNAESIKEAFKKIDAQVKKIDYMIYCSGRGLLKELEATSEEEIKDILDINLRGAIYINREVYQRMLKSKSGHIVNIISSSGRKPRALETIYCAAKWGLRGFNDSLQLAAEEKGIKVTGVYPGGMKSYNFWKIVPGKDTSQFLEPSLVASKILEMLENDSKTKELIIDRTV